MQRLPFIVSVSVTDAVDRAQLVLNSHTHRYTPESSAEDLMMWFELKSRRQEKKKSEGYEKRR